MNKLIGGIATFVLGAGILLLNANVINEEKKEEVKDPKIAIEQELPRFKSQEELEKMIDEHLKNKDYGTRYYINGGMMIDDAVVMESATAKSDSVGAEVPAAGNADGSYSETNTQVKGVDEADIVKTNGEFIYYLTDNKLVVVKATPADNMKIEKIIDMDKQRFTYGRELYIDNNYIVVISNDSREIKVDQKEDTSEKSKAIDMGYIYNDYDTVSVITVIDINTYEKVRKFEVSGSYVSSRKIDNNIYLVSNKYVYNDYHIMPVWRDSCIKDEYVDIPATDIYYFRDFEDCNYMMVSTINLNDMNEKVDIQTFLGAGTEVYASKDSLFVARIKYDYKKKLDVTNIRYGYWYNYDYDITTNIHKFDIKDGKVTYAATGSVPGGLLNQFSMDEYNGYFRITTTNDTYDDDSDNNLYVLDSNMNVVGKIEGLAEGERIYSTRFMGDKCYVVTYKTVDPLFVIDLSEPTNPTVLGELKIPGFSSYLHPLGENYLIGFGEDSVEKSYINWNGNSEVTAYSTGLKLAIFDVTDFSNPKELYSVKIGGRGSWSELLSNHKTLLFDEEKKIFAFPAYIYSEEKAYDNGVPAYGKLEFSGALVFNLSVEDGISLRGKITHCDKARERWGYGDIERLLYIGDTLYTLSNQKVMASDINTIEEISEIDITK